MSVTERSTVQSLGPIGDEVVYENDSVRVWTFSVDAGGIKRMHHHAYDYVIIAISGGDAEITTSEGKARLVKDAPGSVIWQDGGETHQLRNLTDHKYQNVLVELLDRPAKT